jgi:signal transduction histidine kinase
MLHSKDRSHEQLRLESIRRTVRKSMLIVVSLTLLVLVSIGIWVRMSTRRFSQETVSLNQEHLLDIARIEAKFLKSLLLSKADYSLTDFTSDLVIGKKGYVWIIDANGIVVSHPDHDQVGQNKMAMAIKKREFSGYDWSELEQIVRLMQRGEEGVGIYRALWWTEDNSEVSRKLVGYAPLQVGDRLWSIAACMSFDEIIEPIENHTQRTVGIAGMAVLLFGAAGGTFYRNLKRENQALQIEVMEHKRTKEELQQAHDGLERRVEERTLELKHLEHEIVKIHDTVQGNVGRDLHDGLLQQLSGLTFYCDALGATLSETSSPHVADANEICRHLRQLTSWVRDLSKGLYPADLDGAGLAPALTRLASTASHLFSISVVFECHDSIRFSDTQVVLHLYRIAQEAVNNAIKHGNARNIRIQLQRSPEAIVLSVKDDGCGFSQEGLVKGSGIKSINYRAQAINAVVEFQSRMGNGTLLTCSLTESQQAKG